MTEALVQIFLNSNSEERNRIRCILNEGPDFYVYYITQKSAPEKNYAGLYLGNHPDGTFTQDIDRKKKEEESEIDEITELFSRAKQRPERELIEGVFSEQPCKWYRIKNQQKHVKQDTIVRLKSERYAFVHCWMRAETKEFERLENFTRNLEVEGFVRLLETKRHNQEKVAAP